MGGDRPQGKMRIGVARYEDYKRRTINIAKGKEQKESKGPNLWFESLEALVRILNDKNLALLSLIRDNKPKSISDLSRISGRPSGTLSRNLNRLAEYGIVDLENVKNRKVPKVRIKDFEIHLSLPEHSPTPYKGKDKRV